VFHSEADFQHALAWALRDAQVVRDVRLEYRPHGLERVYLDMWGHTAHGPLALELKYVTRRCSVEVSGEPFDLNNHDAHDLRRYDFIKDLVRLERVVEAVPTTTAAAIFLTNDPGYWTPPRATQQIDAAFRIHEGRKLEGLLAWGINAGVGTMRGREDPLTVRGSSLVTWRDYSDVGGPSGRFRYLLIEIPLQSSAST
jgi:hypothetical protein